MLTFANRTNGDEQQVEKNETTPTVPNPAPKPKVKLSTQGLTDAEVSLYNQLYYQPHDVSVILFSVSK